MTTEPLAFASLSSWNGTVGELLDAMFDPTVTYDDLKWIKEQWPGKLVVKGVQNVDDAITLSNHGGRQLDRAPIPFHLLPEVVHEVGNDTEVHLDTGIMSGADIVASVALGARFTLIGRINLHRQLSPDGRHHWCGHVVLDLRQQSKPRQGRPPRAGRHTFVRDAREQPHEIFVGPLLWSHGCLVSRHART